MRKTRILIIPAALVVLVLLVLVVPYVLSGCRTYPVDISESPNPLAWLKDAQNVDEWKGGPFSEGFSHFLAQKGAEPTGSNSESEIGIYALSLDGKRALIAPRHSSDKLTVAHVVDTASGKVICSLDIAKGMNVSAISPDDARIAIAPLKGVFTLWNVNDGKQCCDVKADLPDSDRFEYVCFSPDGRQIVAASRDNHILAVFNAETGEKTFDLGKQDSFEMGVDFSRDGSRIVVTDCFSGTVCVMDSATGRALSRLEMGRDGIMPPVEYSPGSKTILYQGKDRSLKIMDAATGKAIETLVKESPAHFLIDTYYIDPVNVNSAHFSRRGDYVYARTFYRGRDTIMVWSVSTSKRVLLLPLPGELKTYELMGIYGDALYLLAINDAGATYFLRIPISDR